MKKIITILILVITTTVFSQNTIEKKIGEFSEFKAFDLINVTMIKSNENKVIIEGRNRRNVQVVNKNGKLKIRMELEESYDGNNTKVTLYYTSVDIIDANEGADITVENTIDQFDIKFKAQEGGKITADVKATYTDVRAVTGGEITLTGESKNQDISIYTGGEFYGENFKTQNTEVSINAAGEARVNASEFVEVRVRAGGDVYIYGNPKEIDQKTVLGGRVKRM
ncbi:head GIN domain-containing protein [Winogradskyella jejuensis]|uniref:Putative auto-transporter adhesin, head GIN domain n=1 Tax=Winogradskyella jejuensis TaxID=1089305 RepID=A0A1M5MXS0_9FLAO|nr:head GIN domain-containing protein [Winogradskyella jejuensis]SHG82140.1 Putative auto-transporter adhesin, head GIN domain [Winogradskyella jejuensis]